VTTEAKGMQVSIMGREFRISCTPDEQKSLLEAVDYLNQKMQEIKDQRKVTGVDRIAIMAALNISHEFLMNRAGAPVPAPVTFDASEFKRRIAGIETTLDQAMAEQEKLF
jgi:cell division protein ZapA